MNRNLPPSYGSILSHFRNPLVLGGVLLCLASLAAPGQSVSFAGSEETLPFIGLSGPRGGGYGQGRGCVRRGESQ